MSSGLFQLTEGEERPLLFVPRGEGQDLAWSYSGWPGARGFLLPPGGDRLPDFSPFPTEGCLTSLRVRTVLRAILHDFAPGQASSELFRALAKRPPGKKHSACLGASGSRRKTKAPHSQLASVLWEGNGEVGGGGVSRMLPFPPS